MSHVSQSGSSSLLGLPSLPLSIVANITKEKNHVLWNLLLDRAMGCDWGGGGSGWSLVCGSCMSLRWSVGACPPPPHWGPVGKAPGNF